MELKIALQPKQLEAFKRSQQMPVFFFGGARGGGKSYLVRAREIYRRLKFPKTAGLIVRKTYPELRSNHIIKFFEEYPQTAKWFNKAEKTIYYPNGSRTEFSYLKNEMDVYNYQGREFEDISIDEITQHLEETFKILRASNRTSNQAFTKAGGRVTMLLTGNPGGIGHQWVKRIFVDRDFIDNERAEDFDFLQSFVQDNKALIKVDPEYVKRLEDLPDYLRRAYLEGSWDIHAGQAFNEMRKSVHIIDSFEFPKNTRYFASYDHGFNHPFSFQVFAVTLDGHVYVIKHLTGRLKRVDEISNLIVEACEGLLGTVVIYAGLDLWTRQRDGSPTMAEQFFNCGIKKENGFILAKANANREQGVAQIRKYLAYKNTKTGIPLVRFFKNCEDVYNTVSGMQYDEHKPEDVMKINAVEGRGGDDAYDAFRYGLMSRAYPNKEDRTKPDPNSPYELLQARLKRKKLQRSLSEW